MANGTGMPFVGKLLLASALGCGVSGALLLQHYIVLGVLLCAVAIADLGLVWLLRWSALARHADPSPSPR